MSGYNFELSLVPAQHNILLHKQTLNLLHVAFIRLTTVSTCSPHSSTTGSSRIHGLSATVTSIQSAYTGPKNQASNVATSSGSIHLKGHRRTWSCLYEGVFSYFAAVDRWSRKWQATSPHGSQNVVKISFGLACPSSWSRRRISQPTFGPRLLIIPGLAVSVLSSSFSACCL